MDEEVPFGTLVDPDAFWRGAGEEWERAGGGRRRRRGRCGGMYRMYFLNLDTGQ